MYVNVLPKSICMFRVDIAKVRKRHFECFGQINVFTVFYEILFSSPRQPQVSLTEHRPQWSIHFTLHQKFAGSIHGFSTANLGTVTKYVRIYLLIY